MGSQQLNSLSLTHSQVFMMRAPVDAEETSEGPGELCSYQLAARSERDVQEIEVLATLTREEMKEALADALEDSIDA